MYLELKAFYKPLDYLTRHNEGFRSSYDTPGLPIALFTLINEYLIDKNDIKGEFLYDRNHIISASMRHRGLPCLPRHSIPIESHSDWSYGTFGGILDGILQFKTIIHFIFKEKPRDIKFYLYFTAKQVMSLRANRSLVDHVFYYKYLCCTNLFAYKFFTHMDCFIYDNQVNVEFAINGEYDLKIRTLVNWEYVNKALEKDHNNKFYLGIFRSSFQERLLQRKQYFMNEIEKETTTKKKKKKKLNVQEERN